MSISKKFYIPHKSSDSAIRVLLFEKTKSKLDGISFCCWINDVPVYSDLSSKTGKVLIGTRKENKFIIVGYELEQIKTDSFILQKLVNIIEKIYEKTDLDSRD